jgi:hypothetical protein
LEEFSFLNIPDVDLLSCMPSQDQPAINQLEIPVAGVFGRGLEGSLQRPVEMSQIFTTPSESLEMIIPSFACRVMDLIGEEEGV